MYTVLIVLIVIASILMCLIVLIQESKGGGLASGFSASNQIMGVRKTTDIIEKTTWGLAIVMVVLSVFSAYLLPTQAADTSVVLKENSTSTLPSLPQSNSTATPGAAQQQGASQQGASQQGAQQQGAQQQGASQQGGAPAAN